MPLIQGIRRIALNFDPTDEQRRWRDLARDFAQGEIRPRAAQLDREQKFPYDIVAKMTDLGFMGMTVPEEYGGSGATSSHITWRWRRSAAPTPPSASRWRPTSRSVALPSSASAPGSSESISWARSFRVARTSGPSA